LWRAQDAVTGCFSRHGGCAALCLFIGCLATAGLLVAFKLFEGIFNHH
jgi:hypothetical protein